MILIFFCTFHERLQHFNVRACESMGKEVFVQIFLTSQITALATLENQDLEL